MPGFVDVEWDEAKSLANQDKHGVSFEEASALFSSGVDYLEIFDEQHSIDEERFIAIDRSVAAWSSSSGQSDRKKSLESSVRVGRPSANTLFTRRLWRNNNDRQS